MMAGSAIRKASGAAQGYAMPGRTSAEGLGDRGVQPEDSRKLFSLKIIAGAMIGGVFGVLTGRASVCGAEKCNAKVNLVASIVAGAVFGAAVAYWLHAQ